jgi:hypothetical protein
MDKILLPSKINTHYWIHCIDKKIEKTYPHIDGKYVMFFPKDELDERWKEANILYKSGKLIGINSMKVSTQKKNAEGINKYKNGVIIFYCGPSENKERILEYGRNLLKLIYYNDSNLYYKSEKSHLRDNSRRYSNLYTIDVDDFYNRPRRESDKLSVNQSTVYNYNMFRRPQQSYRVNNEVKPSSRPFVQASSRPYTYDQQSYNLKNHFIQTPQFQSSKRSSNGWETFFNNNWNFNSPTQFDNSYDKFGGRMFSNNMNNQFDTFNYRSFYPQAFFPHQNFFNQNYVF